MSKPSMTPADAVPTARTLAQAWQALQQWPWLDTLRTLRLRFRDDRLGITAGSLTFTTVIALVPLATVAFAIFTAFPMFGTFRKALETYLVQNLVPDQIARPVLLQLTQFAVKANRVGVVGLTVLGVTAIALLLTIDRALNGIWRVRRRRPIAQRVLVYWGIATLGPLILGVSLSLTGYALAMLREWVQVVPGGVSLVLNLIELALMTIGMAGLFRFVPAAPVRWVHALSGGVFVAVGFEAARRLLAWYLSAVPTYSTIYGAFATVPILLVWVYLGWVIVLLGAVIAAYAPSLQMRVTRLAPRPGWRFTLALQLLAELDAARAHAVRGTTMEALAQRLRLDPLQLEPVVEDLVSLDWIGRLDEGEAPRLVLLVDPARTPLAPLVEALLLTRQAGNASLLGLWPVERTMLASALPQAAVH